MNTDPHSKIEYELALRAPQLGGFGFVIRWEWSYTEDEHQIYQVDAKCYRCEAAVKFDDQGLPTAPFQFSGTDILKSLRPVQSNELDRINPVLNISLKWDGCSNNWLPSYIHLCEPDHLIHLADLIKYVIRKAVATMEDSAAFSEAELTEGDLQYLPSIPYVPQS
ncbi:hypothetical protein LUCX_205 [Xanthomonas phage vB_XciM_LucasX]|nr:hypothetical protein LUCX_205 [Xanthomonas phage vB_XciM_LucasX]